LRVSSLRQTGDDLVQHRLQRLVGWLGYFDEDRLAFGVALVYAVQHQAVKVNDEVGGRAKALDQRDRAAVSLFSLQTCLPEQVARDDAVHHLQHRRRATNFLIDSHEHAAILHQSWQIVITKVINYLSVICVF